MRTNRKKQEKQVVQEVVISPVPPDFIEKIKSIVGEYSLRNDRPWCEYHKAAVVGPDTYICGEPVITGGVEGGSCWDSSDPQPFTRPEAEATFKALDTILEVVCPNITYLQYRKLAECVQKVQHTENEYYGNSTDYEVKCIKIRDLYERIPKE